LRKQKKRKRKRKRKEKEKEKRKRRVCCDPKKHTNQKEKNISRKE